MSNNTQISNMQKPSLVIIGNGMATGRLLDELIKRDANKFNITVIGKEPYGSYNRIMLSAVLAGDSTIDGIMQKPKQWYADNNVTFHSGCPVETIDRVEKVVTLADQSTIAYDELIIATGSRTATIPAKNQNLTGIFNFRDIADTKNIQAFANSDGASKSAIVIGGGLLGLEAAYGLAISGVKVTLIHRNKWLLNRQLDKIAGDMLQTIMAEKNIEFVLGNEVASFEGETDLTGATLTNGEFIAAQMAVIATGITPNKELAQSADIDFDRAILVDDYMQTSDSAISALGECCQHKNATFGLVDPIWQQCQTLAERLINNQLAAFKNAPVPTKLKVSGVQLFSAGQVESTADTHTVILLDKKASIYRKIITKDNRIVGVVLFGDVSSGMAYFDLMQNQTSTEGAMPELLIGAEYMPTTDAENDTASAA